MQGISRQKVMLVDDNKTNLMMGKKILDEYYDVYALPSAEKLFQFLERVRPDLILLDIEMPNMNGYEAIKVLKADREYEDIPVIFVTAKSGQADEYEGLLLGAIDYVTKPFSASLLLKRIENHMLIQSQKCKLQEFNQELVKMLTDKVQQVSGLQNAIIGTVADLVEFRDNSTGEHIDRSQRYIQILVDQMIKDGVYLDELLLWDMDTVLPSSQLHDLGKIAISDTILNKPGKLTDEEFEIIKTHAMIGVEAIQRMERLSQYGDFLEYARIFAESHHEKWDGSGYPYGLKAHDIPLEGRIMAVADVYDALTSERPYKKAFSAKESADIIIDGSDTHFDPTIVLSFRKVLEQFEAVAKEFA